MVSGRVQIQKTRAKQTGIVTHVGVPLDNVDGIIINIISATGVPMMRTTFTLETARAMRDALVREDLGNG